MLAFCFLTPRMSITCCWCPDDYGDAAWSRKGLLSMASVIENAQTPRNPKQTHPIYSNLDRLDDFVLLDVERHEPPKK